LYVLRNVDKGRTMKKTLIGFGYLLLFMLGGSVVSVEGVVDRVVAVVNQEIITLSEVEKWVEPFQKEITSEDRLHRKEQLQEYRRRILEQLIDEKLIDQEVRKFGIKVTSKELEGVVEDIKRRNGFTQEDMEKALAREGLTVEAFKKQVEKGLQRRKLIQSAVKTVSKPSEKELREFYQKNVDAYRTPVSYRPGHILFVIPKEATPGEIQEIKKKCQKALDRIRRGEDFRECAVIYSEDATAKDGGDLGYFKKGDLLPVLEKEILRLNVGEVSGIVRTEFGFHIVKLYERKGGEPLPFEEVKEKVETEYYAQETEKSFKNYLATLKEKSIIEIKL
jgi:peptidyl-prolyl cis-trans isomerase SurA